MYNFDSKIFDSDSNLIHFLETSYKEPIAKQCIMSGHYLLLYNANSKELYPSIKEETTDPVLKDFIDDIILDFPLRTFKIGLSLIERMRTLRIALLVNDLSFRSKSISQHDREEIKGEVFTLRRNYFHNPDSIPKTYRRLIREVKLSESDVFLMNIMENAGPETKLPSKSYFFAESVLHKNFRKRTLPTLLKGKNVYCTVNGAYNEVRFTSPWRKNKGDYCISGENTSPCMAIAIQFFYELFTDHAMEHIIMLVPDDCEDSVNKAAEVILQTLRDQGKQITIVSNLEHEVGSIRMKRHFYE